MTTLIIGSGGFIGSALTDRLSGRDERMIAADLEPPEAPAQVTAVGCDVTSFDDVAGVIEEYEPETVVTLAYVLGAESDDAPEQAVRVNCVGMDNVFRAATEMRAFDLTVSRLVGRRDADTPREYPTSN